jgi:D-amino-acid dehydrogenase
MMPDMMPRVRAGRRPGVFYNSGHGHLGWTLSAATAQILAEQVVSSPRAAVGGPRTSARPLAAAA